MNIRKFIGTKEFYKAMLALAIPIIIQNGITNFVNLLDNIMVGSLGTEQMSGVSIVNQLIFVFNLCVFGAMSGAGIFGAQYYGKGDQKGIRNILRLKIWIAFAITGIALAIFHFFGESLILLFLHEGGQSGDLAMTLEYSKTYLNTCRFLLLPFALVQAYSSTLRETNNAVPPMRAGLIAVLINLCLNWVLIFGNLGAPALGVEGAAIATVIARIAEFGIVAWWTHSHGEINPYATGLFSSLKVPKDILVKVARKGTPILVNELLWSGGVTVLSQCYSLYGLSAVAATSISSTITNLFNIVIIAMGNCVGIIVGNLLGANKFEEAVDTDRKLIAFSVASSAVVGLVMFLTAHLFPQLYNTTDEVRNLAAYFLRVSACCMPFHAFTNGTYFTLRSGGRTFLTFLTDSGYMWAVTIPVAVILSRCTGLNIMQLYLFCQIPEALKCLFGGAMVARKTWVRNFVDN